MGSSISAIYDDYDDYEFICNTLEVKPKDINHMYDHLREILNQRGYNSKYDYFSHLRKMEDRNKKIDSILNI